MAKNQSSGLQYKKYKERRQKSQATAKKIHRKAVNDLKKISRKRESAYKKRMASYKREAEKKRTKVVSTKTVVEPMSSEDKKITMIFLLILVITIIVAFKFGISMGLLAGFLIIIIAMVCVGVKDSQQRKKHVTNLTAKNIEEMQQLLEDIEGLQDVINTSNDVNAVECSIEAMLYTMDQIMSYSEEDLNVAGMTKSTMEQQKQYIIDKYDILISQTKERACEIEKNIVQVHESKPEAVVYNKREDGALIDNDELPTLETLVKKAYPSKYGLYPHEILMLYYANTYLIDEKNNHFQGFWFYQYAVKEPQKILDSLYERGFLTNGDLRSTIEKLKVVDIKAELQSINEKVTGKKEELINRLMETADLHLLEEKYPNRYYALTQSGEKEIQDNEYVVYLHKTKFMSVWDMNICLNNFDSVSYGYRDILWREFNIQSGAHFKAGNMGLYRNTRMDMYQFLMEEEKWDEALFFLCEVVAYDLSGMGNNEQFSHEPEMKKYMLQSVIEYGFPYTDSNFTIPPAVVGWLSNMKEILHLSEKSYKEKLYDNFQKIILKRRIFTNEECVEIVINEIGNHPRKLSALYKQAEERLKEELLNIYN